MKQILTFLVFATILVACQEQIISPPDESGEAVFLVEVVPGETFRILLDDPEMVVEARRLMASEEHTVVHGELVRGSGSFNTGFSWHLRPETVTFVDLAMEICDGRPSFLEAELEYFLESVKFYCPWGARIIAEE